MDFVALMLFTPQVFHLDDSLLFQSKSHPGVLYKRVD